jgi:hypothetical protein
MPELLIYRLYCGRILNKIRDVLLGGGNERGLKYPVKSLREICAAVGCREEQYRSDRFDDLGVLGIVLAE